MSTLWWDPFRDIVTLRQMADDLMGDTTLLPERRTQTRRGTEQTGTLPVDVYEAKEELVIRASIPGASLEDVDIRVDNDVITVSATIHSDAESEEGRGYTWYRHEIGHGRFSRSLSLPETYEAGAATAKLDNGILTLHIPKKEEAKPKQIKVTSDPALSESTTK